MVAVKSEITAQDAVEFEGWLKAIGSGRSKAEIDFIRRACVFAQRAHDGQTRASGEPYFQHSLAVANILADLRLDYETIAAAILHDVPEDTSITLEELQSDLSTARLVDGARWADSGISRPNAKAKNAPRPKACANVAGLRTIPGRIDCWLTVP
jgi:(p)ppGpp synthase/HD superfamily hydrolase